MSLCCEKLLGLVQTDVQALLALGQDVARLGLGVQVDDDAGVAALLAQAHVLDHLALGHTGFAELPGAVQIHHHAGGAGQLQMLEADGGRGLRPLWSVVTMVTS